MRSFPCRTPCNPCFLSLRGADGTPSPRLCAPWSDIGMQWLLPTTETSLVPRSPGVYPLIRSPLFPPSTLPLPVYFSRASLDPTLFITPLPPDPLLGLLQVVRGFFPSPRFEVRSLFRLNATYRPLLSRETFSWSFNCDSSVCRLSIRIVNECTFEGYPPLQTWA